MTALHVIVQVLQAIGEIAGGLYVLTSIVATFAPKGSAVAAHATRWAADLRKIRQTDEEALRRLTKVQSNALIQILEDEGQGS